MRHLKSAIENAWENRSTRNSRFKTFLLDIISQNKHLVDRKFDFVRCNGRKKFVAVQFLLVML